MDEETIHKFMIKNLSNTTTKRTPGRTRRGQAWCGLFSGDFMI